MAVSYSSVGLVCCDCGSGTVYGETDELGLCVLSDAVDSDCTVSVPV